MNDIERKFWIDTRAEQIKYFQDTRNGHLLSEKYPLDKARKIAESQLKYDINHHTLRISLEELLMLNNEECIQLINERTLTLFKESAK